MLLVPKETNCSFPPPHYCGPHYSLGAATLAACDGAEQGAHFLEVRCSVKPKALWDFAEFEYGCNLFASTAMSLPHSGKKAALWRCFSCPVRRAPSCLLSASLRRWSVTVITANRLAKEAS